MRTNFSPRSKRTFTSTGVISNSSIDLPFQTYGRFSIRNCAARAGNYDFRGVEGAELLSLKFWKPLLKKSSNPLVAIIRQVTTNLFADFIVASLGEFLLSAGKECFLRRPDRQPRSLGNFLRKCLHCRFKLRRRNYFLNATSY